MRVSALPKAAAEPLVTLAPANRGGGTSDRDCVNAVDFTDSLIWSMTSKRKLESEPGAVATGSATQLDFYDPVATAPGSDTMLLLVNAAGEKSAVYDEDLAVHRTSCVRSQKDGGAGEFFDTSK